MSPNRSHSGILKSPWWWCGICGREFRTSDLEWQHGQLRCSECWDNPIAWERDRIIADTLSDGTIEADVDPILKEGPPLDDEEY